MRGESKERVQKQGGFTRLVRALGHQYDGLRHGLTHDPAIRQVLGAFAVLVPLSALLPVGTIEHLILVLSMMLVVLMEFLNSAIEAAVDRISTERHALSGRAKDYSSLAVGISVLMSGLCWLVIAGPVAIQWIGQWWRGS